ncbi:hypothetical protein JHK87_034428 [Glycine soja]|nr:hypothetical protein JHK87_034428 [Glycine soja]
MVNIQITKYKSIIIYTEQTVAWYSLIFHYQSYIQSKKEVNEKGKHGEARNVT